MSELAVLEQQRDDYHRAIANLETQVKGLREYISLQENNLRRAPDAVRDLTERGLAEARSELSIKELRLQQVRQDLHATQVVLSKASELARKEQDIQTLERERERIAALLNRARADLQQLNQQLLILRQPATPAEYALIFGGRQRITLPTTRAELLLGCPDPGIVPDIDLTPFGGTASGVSRRHALLRFNGGTWTVTDLNTTNGTFVNGARLAPNTPTRLDDQARLRLGGVDATFALQTRPVMKTTRLN